MRKYIEPSIRIIDLETEGAILSESESFSVCDEEGDEDVVLTEKKNNFWDRDGIWR